MTRIVKGPEGVKVDPTGKAHGRGAYLHDKRSCWIRGIDGALEHTFKLPLTDQEREELLTFMENNVPDENNADKTAEGISG
jgi:predicted RNA-binding protein YlxR (DUF448 family)